MAHAVFEPGTPQVKEDGRPYPFLIVRRDGVSLAADSVSELVDAVLPGHADLDTDGQFLARLESLQAFATDRQLADFESRREAYADANDGADLAAAIGEGALTAIYADKAFALEFDGGASWSLPIPLFVLASAYAPVSQVPLPAGEHVIALDAATERTYLDALAKLDVVTLLINEPVLRSEATDSAA